MIVLEGPVPAVESAIGRFVPLLSVASVSAVAGDGFHGVDMPNGAVGSGKRMTGALPSELRAGASLVHALAASGVLGEVARRFFIARKPGYMAVDGLLFLLCYFSAPLALGGLRGFYEAHREWAPVLGALGGRKRLMSSGSLSRLLNAADATSLADAGRWWLLHASGALDVLRSPAVMSRDARGSMWHVFDFDPSRQAFRQRALPDDPALPPADRDLQDLAAPGYAGRKRGETVCSEGMLQHHGSSLWLDATVQKGNGDPRSQLASALAAVVATCQALAFPQTRALVRTDGQFGNVPSFSAAVATGVGYLSRVSRPEILALPEVRSRLNAARWRRVPDSRAGPARYAADLGEIALPPGDATRREDGSAYEPVVVRVVVSRYGRSSAAKPVGTVIGDEVFECFGSVGLRPEEWPAATVVAAYYGRCSQENSFCQLDRELAAENVWAKSCGGQQLALLCLLFVWNARVVEGVRRHPPLPPRGEQPAWTEEPSPELPELPVGDCAADVPQPPTEEPAPAAPTPTTAGTESPEAGANASDDQVVAALVKAGLPATVAARPGWTWDQTSRYVRSPQGILYRLVHIEPKHTHLDLRFRAYTSEDQTATKGFHIPLGPGAALLEAWNARPRGRRPKRHIPTKPVPPIDRNAWLRPAAPTAGAPPVSPDWPTFRATSARAAAMAGVSRQRVWVDVYVPPVDEPARHPLVADTAAHRRHQRLSHAERSGRMAAAPGTIVSIRITTVGKGPTVTLDAAAQPGIGGST